MTTHSHPSGSGVAPAGADIAPSASATDPEQPFWLGIAVFGGLLFTVGLLLGGAL